MKSTVLIALLISLAACKRGQVSPELTPTTNVVGDVAMIEYDPPKASFKCVAPKMWGIREDDDHGQGPDGITFLGPQDRRGFTPAINILQYPGKDGQKTDAAAYARSFWKIDSSGKAPATETKRLGANDVITFTTMRKVYKPHTKVVLFEAREDHALIPVKGGFFSVWHTAPSDSYQATLPVFEAVVRSFQPKS